MKLSIHPRRALALLRLLYIFCPLLTLASCSDESGIAGPDAADARTLRVAVICSDEEMSNWQHIAAWAAENVKTAQQGAAQPVHLSLTFKSQDDADLESYVEGLARDSTVDAVVGPTTTTTARIAASAFTRRTSRKPLITPNVTGIEYQRIYSQKRNVWNMSESDIAEIEAFMANVSAAGVTSNVGLIVKRGERNEDEPEFAQWFSFLATEYGLGVDGIYTYQSEDDLDEIARYLISRETEALDVSLLFVPTNYALSTHIATLVDSIAASLPDLFQQFYPPVYCTDAFVSDSIRTNVTSTYFQGFDLAAAPYSGFSLMHTARFKEDVQNGEAQLYDALTLLTLAARRQEQKGSGTLNDAIEDLTTGQDVFEGDWTAAGLRNYFDAIASGYTPKIAGASGTLAFDVANRSGRSGAFYRLWRLADHKYVTLGYFSDENNFRTFTTSGATWNRTATVLDSLDTGETHYPVYPARGDNWAFLIAASPKWTNYRFEADVFAMYHILKSNGYDDDHIVLICEDDIAYNTRNPEQGVIRTSATGDNVYDPSAIDYRLSDLTPADIADILAGRRSERLPEVIGSTGADNVFVFWSGHGCDANPVAGTESYCEYGATGSITHADLRDMLAAVPHRKMMVAVESCYSGKLGEKCVGIPGLVVVTAANANETSNAANWDANISANRSNGFTLGFQTALRDNPGVTLRNLYYTLARSTSGSHVKVYNAAYYGSIYTETMGEYLNLK